MNLKEIKNLTEFIALNLAKKKSRLKNFEGILNTKIYNFKYYSLGFLLPLFLVIFIIMSKYTNRISPIVRKMGKASLEIYLIQGIFFTYVLNGATSDCSDWHDTLSILMIIVSTLLGIVTHWLIDKSGILRLF